MPNKQNLNKRVPFVKNDPRINRKGRPPKLPDLDTILIEVLGEEIGGKTAIQAIITALRKKAASGDVRAAEVLLERGWGKVKTDMNVTFKNLGIAAESYED